MTAKKAFINILFSLIIWTFIVIGLFNWYGSDIVQQDCAAAMRNSQLLLQKYLELYDNKSTTIDTNFDQYELLVDNRPAMDEEQIILDAEKRVPSLPIVYWSKNKNFQQQKNATCAKYPSIFELESNNIYWQTMRTSNGTFQLYGAYYDIRKNNHLGPMVRILGMIDRVDVRLKTFCQFWFESRKEPVIVETFEYKYIWLKEWGNYKHGSNQPYLIACKIPKIYHGLVPNSVSMVEKECDTATNNLRIIYNRTPDDQKKGFAVCVKGIDFLYEDVSVRLIEWIEMINILGAEKIYFYSLQLHPNISKVLSHYERAGKVELMPLTLPGSQPNAPGLQRLFNNNRNFQKRQNEIIPYNDCFYKNMYLYDYIAVLDIDEVIMPKDGATNWREMIEKVLRETHQKEPEGYHSYRFLNVYFLDSQQEKYGWHEDIPKYMHMLQHVHRTKNHSKPGFYVKSIHNTERVVTLTNHVALSSFGKWAQFYYQVEAQTAQMQHYRSDCVEEIKNCKDYREDVVEDKTIWRYKDELINHTKKTLTALGFLRHPIEKDSGLGVGINTTSVER